eukprot:jgi/Psemu1/258292/estExt_Genewise1Plus.C_2720023
MQYQQQQQQQQQHEHHHQQQQQQQPHDLELNWDPTRVKTELLKASAILSHRCLKLAGKWAAEQVMGIPVGTANSEGSLGHDELDYDDEENNPNLSIMRELGSMTAEDWYAKSLVELGEFLHAASVLSREPNAGNNNSSSNNNIHKDITQMGPPRDNLSSYGFYLRAYALYMAGERRKEEDYSELEASGANPYLAQLVREVSEAYRATRAQDNNNDKPRTSEQPQTTNVLDAFGLYVYGMLLREAQKESIPCPHLPHVVLVESILEFPLNWSAWLDLSEVLQQIEQALQPTLATHYMYHFFCAHLMAHHHSAHEDALVLLERLYEPLPDQPLFQSPHVKTQLAVVHYHLRELEQALMWFRETATDDPYSLDHKDVYSNILYVKEDRVGLSHLAHEAVVIDKYRPETCCIVGNYYSLKQQRQKAVRYFQRALKLDRSYTSAWTLMGHEYVELKQTEQAMESYRRAVTVSPKDYRAWYGLGQTYEFLNMYLYALYYYRKAATLRPYDPRMWCAVGQCFAALHKIPDAIRAYERAVAQEDNEGIATQKLAALYRQGGRQEEAAKCYMRHLELRYMITCAAPEHHHHTPQQQHQQQQQQQHPSSAANNAPTLDAIVQGIVLESVEAEALLYLAQYYKSHAEFDTAALLCSRLVEYPGPEKEQAKGLLRELRARGRRGYATRKSPMGKPSHRGQYNNRGLATPGGNESLESSSSNHHNNSPFQFSP